MRGQEQKLFAMGNSPVLFPAAQRGPGGRLRPRPFRPRAAAPRDQLDRAALPTPCRPGFQSAVRTAWDTRWVVAAEAAPGGRAAAPCPCFRFVVTCRWCVSNVQFCVCRNGHSLSSRVYTDLCSHLNWPVPSLLPFLPPPLCLCWFKGLQRSGRL